MTQRRFNIEDARNGAKVQTRDGRAARILCFDAKSPDRPIVALVTGKIGIEYVNTYTADGRYASYYNRMQNEDLVMGE